MTKKISSTLGFTMIELLVASTILIILTTIAIVSFRNAGQSARNGRRKADMETVRQALLLYRTDNGFYPEAGSDFTTLNSTLNTADYLNQTITDPKNSSPYVYSYVPASCTSGECTSFTLHAYLEPDGDDWPVESP